MTHSGTTATLALSILREELSNDPEGLVHAQMALLMARDGRTLDALDLYEEWIHDRSVSPETIAPVIELSLFAGKPKRALAYARQMLDATVMMYPSEPPQMRAFLRRYWMGKPVILNSTTRRGPVWLVCAYLGSSKFRMNSV